MMEKAKKKRRECVYCGRMSRITLDHIPPKSLYPKPRPSLITVPSCYECNVSASRDDEYFRLNLVLRDDTPEHPEAKKVFESVLRGLARRQSSGLRKALLNRMHEFDLVSPGRLYLGKTPGYDVDLRRLDRVAARIIKGLFYHEKGERLPDEYEATALSASGLGKVSGEVQLRFKNIVDSLLSQPPRAVGNAEVFAYWAIPTEENPYTSAWLLMFYQKTMFLGFTTPRKSKGAA